MTYAEVATKACPKGLGVPNVNGWTGSPTRAMVIVGWKGQHLTSETLRAAIYLLKLTRKDLQFNGHRRLAGTRRLGHGDRGFRELNSPHGKDGIT
jgi:hypothetical protein